MTDSDEPRTSELPGSIGRPATNALAAQGITSLAQVAGLTESELLALHGVGPKAVRLLDEALAAQGLEFGSRSTGTD